jgi:hypothetical protein
MLKEELCRRVWWSVYGLDHLLSITLGRPVGIDDNDCDCEMPLDIDDDSLESYCASISTANTSSRSQNQPPLSPSRLTGFLAFSRLCVIAGKIVRAMSSLEMKRQRPAKKLRKTVKTLEKTLADWLRDVPDVVKFSANITDETAGAGAPHLTMCVISYILHAACVINLHRYVVQFNLLPIFHFCCIMETSSHGNQS